MPFEKGVLGQGGPTGPVVPNLPEGSPEMNAVRAGRFVPQPAVAGQATQQAATNTGGLTAIMAQPIPNPLGLPQNTVAWKAPDLAQYDQRFAESLAASRAGIANQFTRALEDITAQENIANQMVGTLPGRYNEVWGGAETQTQQGLGNLQSALEKSGLGGMMTAQQMYAPLQAALAGGKAGFQSTVPLTQLGTQEMFTRQKGALSQARMGAEAPIEEAGREWITRRAGIESEISQREMEHHQREAEREAQRQQFERQQQAEAARARAEEARFQRSLASEERRHKESTAAAKAEKGPVPGSEEWKNMQRFLTEEDIRKSEAPATAATKRTLADLGRTYDPKSTTADRGALIVTAGPGSKDYDAVYKDKDFLEAQRKITEGKRKPGVLHNPLNRNFGYSVENQIKELEKKGKHRSAAVLRHLYSGNEEDRAARQSSLQALLTG